MAVDMVNLHKSCLGTKGKMLRCVFLHILSFIKALYETNHPFETVEMISYQGV